MIIYVQLWGYMKPKNKTLSCSINYSINKLKPYSFFNTSIQYLRCVSMSVNMSKHSQSWYYIEVFKKDFFQIRFFCIY